MKKIIYIFSALSILTLAIPVMAKAEDAPNANVTRRRPDRTSDVVVSPSPAIAPAEVKQVTPPKRSWLAELWAKIQSIFQK